jgi:hypothetical protein
MRLRKNLLALIPGAAHVDLGRTWRGLLLFLLFAVFLNGALVAPLLSASRGLRIGCALAAAGIWIAAFYDALRTAGKVREGFPGPGEEGRADGR